MCVSSADCDVYATANLVKVGLLKTIPGALGLRGLRNSAKLTGMHVVGRGNARKFTHHWACVRV
eukprot:3229528-Prymnesium_polylepis.2